MLAEIELPAFVENHLSIIKFVGKELIDQLAEALALPIHDDRGVSAKQQSRKLVCVAQVSLMNPAAILAGAALDFDEVTHRLALPGNHLPLNETNIM